MTTIAAGTRIALKNILYLTDFSPFSESALPFAVSLARDYDAAVHALHVLTPVIPQGCPEAIEADLQLAKDAMAEVDEKLKGVKHETTLATNLELWPAVERAIDKDKIDLIVVGTHGRTHAPKLLLGSVAEGIFRRSNVPVLTIGPGIHRAPDSGAFHSILLATDFTKPCDAAAPYAVSLAEENDARLILLYVSPETGIDGRGGLPMAEIVQRLRDIVPADARRWCRPAAVVQYGEPADRILEIAAERDADLIVLGVRDARSALGAATHLERAIAHKVVAHAQCPVLTVRG